MNDITLVGLGTNKDEITSAARFAIENADKVVLRTEKVPSADYFADNGIDYISLDYIYEKSKNFDTLAKNLAEAVVSLSKEGNVVYCVEGSPTEDSSCKILGNRKNCKIIAGVSKAEHIVAAARIFGDYARCSAYDFEKKEVYNNALIVFDIDNFFIASSLKEKLSELYGDEYECTYVSQNKLKTIKIYELDRQSEYDYSCAAAILPVSLTEKKRYSFSDLVEIMLKLRSPNGCPWDKVQTHESIRKNLIEECYELVNAIDKKDDENMREELGDVMLQVVFHSQLMQEEGKGDINDVLDGICQKLISRHTHIFGDDKAFNGEQALEVWNKNKNKEKVSHGITTEGEKLMDVPLCLPALMRAQKVGSRAGKCKFDFTSTDGIVEKIKEELSEAVAELNGEKSNLEMECGDLLFAVVNLIRFSKLDAEEALTKSTDKFIDRFLKMEKLIIADGKTFSDLNDEEWDRYYNEAKTH